MVGNGEFVIQVARFGVEADRNERKAFAASLGHDDETEELESGSEVVGSPGKISEARISPSSSR
jgi:hypothetical protein